MFFQFRRWNSKRNAKRKSSIVLSQPISFSTNWFCCLKYSKKKIFSKTFVFISVSFWTISFFSLQHQTLFHLASRFRSERERERKSENNRFYNRILAMQISIILLVVVFRGQQIQGNCKTSSSSPPFTAMLVVVFESHHLRIECSAHRNRSSSVFISRSSRLQKHRMYIWLSLLLPSSHYFKLEDLG